MGKYKSALALNIADSRFRIFKWHASRKVWNITSHSAS